MPGPTTPITNRERAAILLLLTGFINDWKECYLIAEDKSRKDAENVQYIASAISKWKNSGKITKAVEQMTRFLSDLRAEERNRARAEALQTEEEKRRTEENGGGGNVRTDGERRRAIVQNVDYSNPENQTKKLNELINTANDPGEALDALKVLISTQKDDKQAAREQKQVRAYLPLMCQQCPLYEKARKKVTI